MKRFYLLLILVPSLLFSNSSFVEIYKTHDNGMYGRSEDRDIILSIKKSVFKRHETLQVDNSYNFLTAVTLNNEVVLKLQSMLKSKDSVQIGYVKISKNNNIYTIEDDSLFLSFSFSLEKPNREVIGVIENYYSKLPIIKNIVKNYYIDNYIIRIHSAENLLQPEAREITYDEVTIMATIIGDRDQWLWGIHNGKDYLRSLLFQ